MLSRCKERAMTYDDRDWTTKTLEELRDRTRRVETRLTKYLESQGFDTQTQRPEWRSDGYVNVPSPNISLKDVLSVIPHTYLDEVRIVHKGVIIASIYIP